MFVDGLRIAVFVVAIAQTFYGYFFFRHIWRIPAGDDAPGQSGPEIPFAQHPVSVIICARNEKAALSANLQRVLDLNYHWPDGTPAFEVIVVDDGSVDDTGAVL